MNRKFLGFSMLAAALFASAASAQPADRTKVVVGRGHDAVGGAVVHVDHATITAIDPATRSVTLKNEAGEQVTLHAGAEVVNFPQLKVGDVVTFRQTQAVVLGLRKVSDGIRQRTEWVDLQRSAPGARPGLTARHVVQAVTNVTAIDPRAGTVTLRGVSESRTLPVQDRQMLASLKVGDQVEVTFVDSDVVSIGAPRHR